MPRQNQIYSINTLYKITSDLKKRDKKIAFTHGAFDLFHIGHLDLLERSSRICDYLIVGVENNMNIQTYKSKDRPIISEQDRLEIINALNCIDAVFINPYETSKESFIYLYKNLHADYVTIGPNFDFKDKLFPQAKAVGSEPVILGHERLARTTGIVNTILKRVKD